MTYEPSPGQVRRDVGYADALYWLDTRPDYSLAILKSLHTDTPLTPDSGADLSSVNAEQGDM